MVFGTLLEWLLFRELVCPAERRRPPPCPVALWQAANQCVSDIRSGSILERPVPLWVIAVVTALIALCLWIRALVQRLIQKLQPFFQRAEAAGRQSPAQRPDGGDTDNDELERTELLERRQRGRRFASLTRVSAYGAIRDRDPLA
jgi:hypothetical protein